jgi:hypothetical protein
LAGDANWLAADLQLIVIRSHLKNRIWGQNRGGAVF